MNGPLLFLFIQTAMCSFSPIKSCKPKFIGGNDFSPLPIDFVFGGELNLGRPGNLHE